jgi:hypothetical protein
LICQSEPINQKSENAQKLMDSELG